MDELNLVTVEQAKDYCRLTDTGVTAGNVQTIDEVLKDLITRASAFLVEKIGKPYLFAKTSTETRNGNGKDVMFPAVGPINSITSVSVDGVTIPQRPTVSSFGWVFDPDVIYLIGYQFTCGVQNVVINWNCGVATTSRKAYALQQACLELVNIKWQRKKHPDTLTEKSGNMISTAYRDSDMTDSIKLAIQLFMDHVPFE